MDQTESQLPELRPSRSIRLLDNRHKPLRHAPPPVKGQLDFEFSIAEQAEDKEDSNG